MQIFKRFFKCSKYFYILKSLLHTEVIFIYLEYMYMSFQFLKVLFKYILKYLYLRNNCSILHAVATIGSINILWPSMTSWNAFVITGLITETSRNLIRCLPSKWWEVSIVSTIKAKIAWQATVSKCRKTSCLDDRS